MSGGAFEFNQYKIQQIVDDIEFKIENNGKPREKEFDWEEGFHPEYSESTILRFQEAVDLLKLSLVYVHEIDYLLCGDTGEETFKERLDKSIDSI